MEPAGAGEVERNGVRVHWEAFGEGEPTIALLPTWSIVRARHWKFQVPYLARHHRVITFDGRGCGRSDRPVGGGGLHPHRVRRRHRCGARRHRHRRRRTGCCSSRGALWALQVLAADQPGPVLGVVTISPAVPLAPLDTERNIHAFDEPIETTEGWAKYNRHYWRRDYEGFLAFFFGRMFTEAHSTKAIEDCVGWGLETDQSTFADAHHGLDACGRESIRAMCEHVVRHGARHPRRRGCDPALCGGGALAEVTGGSLVTVGGGGHAPHCPRPGPRQPGSIRRFDDRTGR